MEDEGRAALIPDGSFVISSRHWRRHPVGHVTGSRLVWLRTKQKANSDDEQDANALDDDAPTAPAGAKHDDNEEESAQPRHQDGLCAFIGSKADLGYSIPLITAPGYGSSTSLSSPPSLASNDPRTLSLVPQDLSSSTNQFQDFFPRPRRTLNIVSSSPQPPRPGSAAQPTPITLENVRSDQQEREGHGYARVESPGPCWSQAEARREQ